MAPKFTRPNFTSTKFTIQCLQIQHLQIQILQVKNLQIQILQVQSFEVKIYKFKGLKSKFTSSKFTSSKFNNSAKKKNYIFCFLEYSWSSFRSSITQTVKLNLQFAGGTPKFKSTQSECTLVNKGFKLGVNKLILDVYLFISI
jgi:hypothetical protein